MLFRSFVTLIWWSFREHQTWRLMIIEVSMEVSQVCLVDSLQRCHLAAARNLHSQPRSSFIAANTLKFGWLPLPQCNVCQKTFICLPLYRKLSLGINLTGPTPLRVLVGLKDLLVCRPRQPHPPPKEDEIRA